MNLHKSTRLNASSFRPFVLLPVAISSDTMYNILMFMDLTNRRMAQICCLCCAYVSSGIGRLAN